MALSSKDVGFLLNLLSEESTATLSIEAIATQCCSTFSKQDHFKVGCALSFLLLQPSVLVTSQQRLATAAVIYSLYKHEPIKHSPFANVFLHILKNGDVSKAPGRPADLHSQLVMFSNFTKGEKQFVRLLITNPNKELFKRTAAQLLSDGGDSAGAGAGAGGAGGGGGGLLWGGLSGTPSSSSSASAAAFSAVTASVNELESVVQERLRDTPGAVDGARCGVSAVVPAAASSTGSFTDTAGAGGHDLQRRRAVEALLCGPRPPVMSSLQPQFLRLPPPLYNCVDELVYMVPSDPVDHQVAYDPTLLNSSSAGAAETRQLIQLATAGALTLHQQDQLVSQLRRDRHAVYQSGISPESLPDLVEHNPIIAIETLLQLMDSPQITNYFSVLVNMEMSLHSMEVVNRLTTAVELPAEFVRLYVSNCIATCELIKDRYMQNRLVRLVCVFLQSLIRNRIINIQTILVEVQAFCIEFNRIREAAALFRLLKQLDSGEHIGNQPAPGQKH